MNTDKPTYADIDPTGGQSLDEASAGKIFFGLSEQEALELFHKNSLFYLSELMWMGAVGFAYYLRPAVAYLESKESKYDSDAVNILCGNIEHQIKRHKNVFPLSKDWISRFCIYVLTNWDKFAIDDDLYLGLKDRVTKLLELTVKKE